MALPTMMANHAARTVIQTVAANRTGGGKTPSSGNRSTKRPSSGSASPRPNPTPSSPPPAGGGTGGSAPGKTAGPSTATGGTPPTVAAPKAPNSGAAPASATANPREQPRASQRPLCQKERRRRARCPQGHPLVGAGSLRRRLPEERLGRQTKKAAHPSLKSHQRLAHLDSRERLVIPPHNLRRQPPSKTLGQAAKKKRRPLVPIPQSHLALSRQRMAKTPERPKAPATLPARIRPQNHLRVLLPAWPLLETLRQIAAQLPRCRMGHAPIHLPPVFQAHLVRRGIPQRRTAIGRNGLHPNRQEPRPLLHRRRIRLLFLPVSL